MTVFEVEECEHDACLRLRDGHDLTCTLAELSLSTVQQHINAEIVSTFVNSTLSGDLLARMPRLKLIATRSTGYDHVDLTYCRAHGITVCNVPSYGDVTVAEHVFALLLAISRHLVQAVERTRRGEFSQAKLRGFDLRNRCLGVIGVGRIGRRVIEIANGFGMRVVAFDAQPDQDTAAELCFRYADLSTVLELADAITLHVPATASTNHLISDAQFTLMKPGAVLINTSRGSVVDAAALIRALKERRLQAAGLDVLPQERLLRDEAEIFRAGEHREEELRGLLASNVLLQFPNVIVTPHNAYNTVARSSALSRPRLRISRRSRAVLRKRSVMTGLRAPRPKRRNAGSPVPNDLHGRRLRLNEVTAPHVRDHASCPATVRASRG